MSVLISSTLSIINRHENHNARLHVLIIIVVISYFNLFFSRTCFYRPCNSGNETASQNRQNKQNIFELYWGFTGLSNGDQQK